MQRSFLLLALTTHVLFQSCAPKYRQYVQNYKSIKSPQPDYSSLEFWAAHPYKKDPSDSIPLPLKQDHHPDSSVDVFFLHPTTFTDRKDPAWNADLTNAELNAKTDYSTILYQGSAFNEYRVFAPRYRQANLKAYYSDSTSASVAFDTAYEDIKNAFSYYLSTYNHNRLFIIASHSQGTTHAMRLIREMIDGKALQAQLVAAYLVGMYLPVNYFTSLKICEDSLATGCYCAWRSFQTNYTPSYVSREIVKSSIVNPLSWNSKTEHIPKSMNRGSVLRNFNKVYNSVADAKIEKGILWIEKPVFPGSFLLRMKNYHIADINFFYQDIRYNLRQRVLHAKARETGAD